MSESLLDKAVVITGGGTGIGRVAAHKFADEGARVLVVGRSAESLKETAEGRANISVATADVAAPSGPDDIVAAAESALGGIDVLVNNAAITRPQALGEIDRDDAVTQLHTNLLGPLLLTQRALPHLVAARGTVVNVTSVSGARGWPANSVYGGTKVALDFMTRTWAVELGARGVRVVSVAPGVTQTPILEHAGFTEEQMEISREFFLSRIPLGRIADPEEIARWIVQVADPGASYLTGAVLQVDGGINVA